MKTRFSRFALFGLFVFGPMLPACDGSAENPPVQEEAVEEGLPRVAVEPVAEPVDAPLPSTDAASPGGAAVTEEELPYSDVPPPSREVFKDAACNFEGWIGRKVDEAAVKATGRPYRILEPGAMMTMDHNPKRINVEHDGKGTVKRVWCG
jgi:hypothetical protein